jgi:hypothetical protein
MTRNSIISITAAAALVTSAITPTMAGGRPGPKSGGGFSPPSQTVVCATCLSRVSHYLITSPSPPFPPISGNTGGGSTTGPGHIKCARIPC